ncbi:MAG: hypothetical protein C5B52_08560 [Bacteroidetes bacterium]|nr:MAG: hypothetical protein C5B52_08560 [Bacteroidota bacterium]
MHLTNNYREAFKCFEEALILKHPDADNEISQIKKNPWTDLIFVRGLSLSYFPFVQFINLSISIVTESENYMFTDFDKINWSWYTSDGWMGI